MQKNIITMLSVPEIKQYEKYLGLPSFVGRSKKASLLLKAVVQTIPTYSMSCFKLPTTLCSEIEIIIRNFGGDREVIGERSIRKNGANYVGLKMKEEWIFVSCKSSMMLYWPNKYGDWHHIMALFFRSSKLIFFQMDQSLMPRKIRDLTHGKTYLKGVISLGVGMRWRIGSGSSVRIFTKTDGYQPLNMAVSSLPSWTSLWMPRSPFWLIMIYAIRERLRLTGYFCLWKLLLSKPSP